MRYCIFCADVRPPRDHRRVVRFPDHTHVLVTLVPRFAITEAGRTALVTPAERSA